MSVESKDYTVDFTSGGLRDIMISVDGLYDQTLSYGLGLISVSTVANGDPSVQSNTAAGVNNKVYAHQDRLGGNAYFTDSNAKIVAYNEFDAWGNAYTEQPEDANYSGLNLLTGFTGYTWDAVLGVYFAQARLYDAANKRFVQTDPIGGNVARPVTLNAYLYCIDDPVNHIDPTGMYMPGDEKLGLTKEQTAAIDDCSKAWFSAQARGDQAGMNAAHAAADAIRNMSPKEVTNSAGKSYSGSDPYAGMALSGLPPTSMDILVVAIQKTQPVLSLDLIIKTANAWHNIVINTVPSVSVTPPTDSLPNIMNHQQDLPLQGPPNEWVPQYGPDGALKKLRHYGPDGNADYDIDYDHGGAKHTFPHGHPFPEGERSPNSDVPPNPPVPVPENGEQREPSDGTTPNNAPGTDHRNNPSSSNSSRQSVGSGIFAGAVLIGIGGVYGAFGGGGIPSTLEAAMQ